MVRTIIALLLILLSSGCTVESVATEPMDRIPDLTSYPWVYLRDKRALSAAEEVVSIIAVGDILLGRGVANETDPLRHTAGWLQDAGLALGNLEGVLVDGGTPRRAPVGEPQPLILKAAPASADLLAEAGFDILSLANNHSLDYGQDGLRETVRHLNDVDLGVIGIKNEGGTVAPLLQEFNGLRLAFLAFNAVTDPQTHASCATLEGCSSGVVPWDPATSPQAITAARALADALIVSIHWGFEYHPLPDPSQEAVARAMLDAGADLIVGHHPHFPQRLTVHGDQLVAYSLGNFLFDQDQDGTDRGLALRAFFDGQGLRAVQALPLRAGLQPHLLPTAGAQQWLSQYLPAENRLGYACSQNGCVPADAPPATTSSTFFSGQIDLTGDGQPETIRRQGQQITIYEQGTAVWQSPEAWRVVDVALGDPNDDGRYEIMLAIWQEDAAGHERSQPYIIGHRGGRYDLLWGGRPVADPIRELAVGDVDGDGRDELIVIEELADGSAQALSIWRWAGWTFTHVWRSEFGAYSDLLLVGDERPLISVIASTR